MPKAFLVRKKQKPTTGLTKVGNHHKYDDVFSYKVGPPYCNNSFTKSNTFEPIYHRRSHYWRSSLSDDDLESVLTDCSQYEVYSKRESANLTSPSSVSSSGSTNQVFFPKIPTPVKPCMYYATPKISQDDYTESEEIFCVNQKNIKIFPDEEGTFEKGEGRPNGKPYVCSICRKCFRLSSTLCRHKIIHTTQRPHKCFVCHKSFNRSSTLKTHMRTHNKTKDFMCHVCGKGFHQKGNLRNHILIHTGEKPYSCKLCQKSFNKLSNLKFHMHCHTDHKPYRCRFCKLSMTRRGELKQHIAIYHPNEE